MIQCALYIRQVVTYILHPKEIKRQSGRRGHEQDTLRVHERPFTFVLVIYKLRSCILRDMKDTSNVSLRFPTMLAHRHLPHFGVFPPFVNKAKDERRAKREKLAGVRLREVDVRRDK